MATQVVVLGAGYAGAGAVKRLQSELDATAELTWVSERDYHLVLHESHRVISDPAVESKVAIPVTEIKDPATAFVRGRVTDVDVDAREVHLEDDDPISYDYLLVCLGSATAFYGIEGLEEYSLTLKGLDDAREIHHRVKTAAAEASRSDPARVVVGGAGLSGIQTAGEVARFRDDRRAPIDVKLVEGLEEVFPGNDPEVQGALRKRLLERDIDVLTGDFITCVDERAVYLAGAEESAATDAGEDAAEEAGVAEADAGMQTEAADGGHPTEPAGEDGDADGIDFSHPNVLEYDVLVWTGGITGQDAAGNIGVEQDERSHRLHAAADFQTSDDHVFAIGDTALVEQPSDEVAPPTAQAAWQAAEVAGENVARAIRGDPLRSWTYEDQGTLVSIGELAVAHDISLPVVGDIPMNTFGGPAAVALKKATACKWISGVAGIRRAVDAWSDM
jgi:NADH dehydrogenase